MSGIKEHRRMVQKATDLGLLKPNPERDARMEAGEAKRIGLRNAPLRAVVSTEEFTNLGLDDDGMMVRAPRWKLECGHLVSPPVDMYGERFPDRMRCGPCRQSKFCDGE